MTLVSLHRRLSAKRAAQPRVKTCDDRRIMGDIPKIVHSPPVRDAPAACCTDRSPQLTYSNVRDLFDGQSANAHSWKRASWATSLDIEQLALISPISSLCVLRRARRVQEAIVCDRNPHAKSRLERAPKAAQTNYTSEQRCGGYRSRNSKATFSKSRHDGHLTRQVNVPIPRYFFITVLMCMPVVLLESLRERVQWRVDSCSRRSLDHGLHMETHGPAEPAAALPQLCGRGKGGFVRVRVLLGCNIWALMRLL